MKRLFKITIYFLLAVQIFSSCKKNAADTGVQSTNLNKPPVASAGADQVITLPLDSTELSGSGIDTDGNIEVFRWSKISGPLSYAIFTPNKALTKVQHLEKGVYAFELKVVDNGGLIASDTVIVTVNNGVGFNQPPVAYAGPDQVILLPLDSVELKGSGTDADGSIASYSWDINGYLSQVGQYVNFYYKSDTATMNNLAEGIYWCTLKVVDDKGLSATDEMIVTVVGAGCICYPYPCDAFGDPCNPWDY